MIYPTSLNKTSKIITAFVIALLALIALGNWFNPDISLWLKMLVSLGFVIIIMFTWAYRPLHYSIQDRKLIIARPLNSRQLPLDSIQTARHIESPELGTLLRLWGSGGLFGYYGRFRSSRIGHIRLYTTRKTNLVLLQLNTGLPVLLSPNDPHAFVDELNDRMKERDAG